MPMPESDWAPRPYQSTWPRYSTRPFPPYRFIPGKAPHPRRHPDGHSYGQIEPKPETLHPEAWAESDAYRYGIDLYNFAYWWECHEVFEGFWHAVGPKTEQGQFFQALIQLAAGNLKRFTKNEIAARSLLGKSLRRFAELPDCYMGIDLAELRNKLGKTPIPDLSGTFLLTLECTSNRSPRT
jgi:uncharacterized protein